MTKERMLITGGAGYLGSVITRAALDKGYKVTCLDNLFYHQKTPFLFSDNLNYEFVRGDVRDKSTLEKLLLNVDIIFHLAGFVGVGACNAHPIEARSVNYDSTILLNSLRSQNQILVFPNTNSGYGTKSGETFCTEETPLEPISLYGETKVAAENALLSDNKPVVTLRLATVFGVSPRMRSDLLVNFYVKCAIYDCYVVIFEKDNKRNYIHVKDVAKAFLHSVENFELMKNKPYNVGLEDANLSKAELAELVKKYVPGFDITYKEIGEDPDKRNYIVSNQRILNTGFRPEYSLDYGVRELVKAFSILKIQDPLKNV